MPADEITPEDIQAATAPLADRLDADPAAQAAHEQMAAKLKALAEADDDETRAAALTAIAPEDGYAADDF